MASRGQRRPYAGIRIAQLVEDQTAETRQRGLKWCLLAGPRWPLGRHSVAPTLQQLPLAGLLLQPRTCCLHTHSVAMVIFSAGRAKANPYR